MNEWSKLAVAQVSAGTSGCQTAIPDGKHLGDTWFITDKSNVILVIFVWDGCRWRDPTQKLEYSISTPHPENCACSKCRGLNPNAKAKQL